MSLNFGDMFLSRMRTSFGSSFVRIYNRHGFRRTGERKFEEGTTEYIVELKREPADGKREA